jgi:predicted ATPase
MKGGRQPASVLTILDKFSFVLLSVIMYAQSVTLLSSKFPKKDIYPFSLPIFQNTQSLVLKTPVTLFAGENGFGKSTLLQVIANACGIYIGQETGRTRYNYNPYEDKLGDHLSVEWKDGKVPGSFFGSESFYHFRQILDEWSARSIRTFLESR